MLAADVTRPGTFYLASNRGVFWSSDSGLRWQSILDEWPEPFSGQRANALLIL
jgi:hypothetical protein